MSSSQLNSRSATVLGILAMIFWSTAIGVTRYLIERMGLCAYVVASYCGSGLFLLALTACQRGSLRSCFLLPRKYTLYSGCCFLLYCITLNVGSMLAPSQEIFVQAALVNYLWPALLLLFSVPIFGHIAKWRLLLPGVILALVGIALASAQGITFSSLVSNLKTGWSVYLLMLSAAIAWGLYSNLAKKYHQPGAPSGVPLFQLAVGMIFLLALPWVHEARIEWSLKLCGALAYATIFPTALAYFLWEHGMKHGNQTLLGAISFFIPLGSTLFSCWLLGVPPGLNLLLGCVLVIAGSVLSKKGIGQMKERKGLSGVVGKWKDFDEIADQVESARLSDKGGRDVSF